MTIFNQLYCLVYLLYLLQVIKPAKAPPYQRPRRPREDGQRSVRNGPVRGTPSSPGKEGRLVRAAFRVRRARELLVPFSGRRRWSPRGPGAPRDFPSHPTPSRKPGRRGTCAREPRPQTRFPSGRLGTEACVASRGHHTHIHTHTRPAPRGPRSARPAVPLPGRNHTTLPPNPGTAPPSW